MKLYTEEQVIKAIGKARVIVEFLNNSNYRYRVDDIFDSLTPIELPSDDDEEKNAMSLTKNIQQHIGFNIGSEWMKQQILNQNK